jgi:hypothetical protein
MDHFFNKHYGTDELIMDKEEKENFINEHLMDPQTGTYLLDSGSYASQGEYIIVGENGKTFRSEEEYGKYLIDYNGYAILKLPIINK